MFEFPELLIHPPGLTSKAQSQHDFVRAVRAALRPQCGSPGGPSGALPPGTSGGKDQEQALLTSMCHSV